MFCATWEKSMCNLRLQQADGDFKPHFLQGCHLSASLNKSENTFSLTGGKIKLLVKLITAHFDDDNVLQFMKQKTIRVCCL